MKEEKVLTTLYLTPAERELLARTGNGKMSRGERLILAWYAQQGAPRLEDNPQITAQTVAE